MKTLILVVTTMLTFQANAYTYTCDQVVDMSRNTVFTQSELSRLNSSEGGRKAAQESINASLNSCYRLREAKDSGMSNAEILRLVNGANKSQDQRTRAVILLGASLSLN